jgi:hypothetical protein
VSRIRLYLDEGAMDKDLVRGLRPRAIGVVAPPDAAMIWLPGTAFTGCNGILQMRNTHCNHSEGSIPLPSMIALMVPSGSTRPRCWATMICFPVTGCRHF